MYVTTQTRWQPRRLGRVRRQPLGRLRGHRSTLGGAATLAVSSGEGAAQGYLAGGPIGAAVGALAGLIKGIFADHAANIAGAKTENAAVSAALQAFDASLQAIFQAANAGQVTGTQAAGAAQQVLQTFWQSMGSFTTGAGRADASKGGMNCSGLKCDKKCTVTCCVGCADLAPTIAQAVQVLSSPTGGTVTASTVYGDKYGLTQRAGYSLTYTPPAAGSAAGLASAVTSSTVAGIPLWVLLGGVGLAIYASRQ